MLVESLLGLCIALLAGVIAMQILLLRRKLTFDISPIDRGFQAVQTLYERTERTVRDETARGRQESATAAGQLRQELTTHLNQLTENNNHRLNRIQDTVERQLQLLQREIEKKLQLLTEQTARLTETNAQKIEALKIAVEQKLTGLQQDNAMRLDQMRATVDEKLQSTLNERIDKSFAQVSQQLEQVYKGLGEMQAMTTDVGDLKKVLTNVKTRGTWGEVLLGNLLEQVLAPEQYAANVATKDERERVEFAIRLPGRGPDDKDVVWLPIDAKFPKEDYERLVEAQERADKIAADAAGRDLERTVRNFAATISGKYLNPPKTTDFAIMFLPTEGLYAEVVRRVGLMDILQRECRVIVAGPTTLAALLNALQMGFRTLAIQQRSSEVWKVLGEVKTQFGKYADAMEAVKNSLDQAGKRVEEVEKRTRVIQRSLREVQDLPAAEALPRLVDDSGNGK